MAFDAFLKIDGIEGESTDEKHKNWIEIQSFSHAVMQTATGSPSDRGGRTGGRCDHSEFGVVKALDKASPKLLLHCCNGKHIPTVTIELCRSGGDKQKYMEYKLEDVIVSNVAPGGAAEGGETVPMEQISFAYGKIHWTYTETDHKSGKPKGDVQTYWDLEANKGG